MGLGPVYFSDKVLSSNDLNLLLEQLLSAASSLLFATKGDLRGFEVSITLWHGFFELHRAVIKMFIDLIRNHGAFDSELVQHAIFISAFLLSVSIR